jgi:hypothetical protein
MPGTADEGAYLPGNGFIICQTDPTEKDDLGSCSHLQMPSYLIVSPVECGADDPAAWDHTPLANVFGETGEEIKVLSYFGAAHVSTFADARGNKTVSCQ